MARSAKSRKGRGTTDLGASKPVSEDPWLTNPATVRRFIEQRPHYEQLCTEVAYTLTKLLKDANIRVALITSRAKTLESFLEKIERKAYIDPFNDITDFAGARVVCFYPDDLPKIERLIQESFEVVEKVDKMAAEDIDRFGYSATHFLIKLGQKTVGARYDDLKDKVCEIQVRTVLQDAWALFSHHLMYKHESDIPDTLKREIHALAGTLELADMAFQGIRDKRNSYINAVGESATKNALSEVKTDLDSLREYLAHKYAGRPVESYAGELSSAFSELPHAQYATLQQIDELLSRTEKALRWYYKQMGFVTPDNIRSAAWELGHAIAIAHPTVREKHYSAGKARDLLKEAEKLITNPI